MESTASAKAPACAGSTPSRQDLVIGQIKGFLAENMVLGELVAAGQNEIFTWRGKTSEIEFLVPSGDETIPVEVKAGLNTKARSMQVYRTRYSPPLAILFSGLGTNQIDNGLLHAPLYLAGATCRAPLRPFPNDSATLSSPRSQTACPPGPFD